MIVYVNSIFVQGLTSTFVMFCYSVFAFLHKIIDRTAG